MDIINTLNSIGSINKISDVFNRLNPNETFKNTEIYEISLFENWLLIDFNIVTKNYQYILTRKKELINELKNFEEIYLIQLTMNEGLGVLISLKDDLKTTHIEKDIMINNTITSKLKIEFKKKFLLYPSMLVHRKTFIKKIDHPNLNNLLKNTLKLFKKYQLFFFQDCNVQLDENNFETISSSESSDEDEDKDLDVEEDFLKILGRKSKKGAKRFKTEDGSCQTSLSRYEKKLYSVFLNYKQHFKDSKHNEFIEIQKNLTSFMAYFEKCRYVNIYFNDLVLFILSILYEEYYPSINEHPFYNLSNTRSWIKWTTSYMNFQNMLEKNNASLSYRIDIKINSHELYRAVTRFNDIGSNMTDEESRVEFESFREKYKVKEIFEPNLSLQFVSFILTTLSILNLNLKVHYSINNFLIMNANFKAGSKFYIPLFKRFTSKYKINVIKCFNRKNKALGYIYFENLYWQSIYSNSDFFDNLLSSIFCSLTSTELDSLKSEILLIGTGNNITPKLEIVKSNLKKWTHTIPFLNCKITLQKNDKFLSTDTIESLNPRRCLYIDNYQLDDTITNDGVINYEFPHEQFMTKGINDGLLSLDNEERYSVYFTAFIKTIFGEDPTCGSLSVFNCVQFLMDSLVTSSFFLKTKALQMALLKMGPAGCGKTKYLDLKQSVFSSLAKPINMTAHFSSNEINSSKSNSEETLLFFSNEASQVDFSDFKSAISDLSYKGSTRNLYEQHDQNSNFSNGSYIINQNAEGISYFTKDVFKLNDAFVRRLFPVHYSSNIGGSDVRSNVITYYKDIRKLNILNELSPDYHSQTLGLLFYLLDLIEYFGIGNWDENNIIKPCYANLRRAVMGQFEPMKILNENLIFLDEIYPDDSNQMLMFKMNDKGLNLKEVLNGTGKYNLNQLTPLNVEKIAKNLKKLLNIDTRFCYTSEEWKIYGVKHYRECSELEIKASEQPHKDWFGFNKNYKIDDVQSCLPSALRFYVHENIKDKFNSVINVLFMKKKIKHEFLPECAPNFKTFTTKQLLERIKNFDIF